MNLHGVAGQPDHAFHIAFVGFFRIPENDDVAALDMSPAHALDLVIDELIYQQPLAVLQLRHHRSALDNDRLDSKNTNKNKHHYYQKDVAKQSQTFDPETAFRLTPRVDDVDAVIVQMMRIKADLFILAEIEHNRVVWMSAQYAAVGCRHKLIFSFRPVFVKGFLYG